MTQSFLFAPESYWKLPESERNGPCGPGRGVLEKLIPETAYGLCITPACSIHDFMYTIGQTVEDKQEADRVFLNNMIRLIETAGGFKLIVHLRLRRAFTYYEAVCHFGGPCFWNDKKQADRDWVGLTVFPAPYVATGAATTDGTARQINGGAGRAKSAAGGTSPS